MGRYDLEYEKYYGSLKRGINSSPYPYYGKISNRGGSFTNKKGNYLVRRIIRDLIGVLILFIFIIACKVTSNPQTKSVYNYSKEVIDQNYNYSNLKTRLKSINIKYIEDRMKNTVKQLRVNGEN
ncbi:endopeptidase [Clostridium sp. WILCCON 0269]|uniref:Endopeptidase n=1 Tax=Candidatus Clostridium eludens TaxID=3381663 RepID=A0ABW8SJ75_9CLOT